MKNFTLAILVLISIQFCSAQNVGIGVPIPTQKLDVAGTVRATNLMTTSGTQYEILKKGSGDNIVYSQGNTGLGLNYIISFYGIYPSNGGTGTSVNYSDQIVGEVRLFAGNFPPTGWAFCQGQLLSIATYEVLFTILGTTYGGDGITTFALPDLRGAVPVGPGTPTAGQAWNLGEKSN